MSRADDGGTPGTGRAAVSFSGPRRGIGRRRLAGGALGTLGALVAGVSARGADILVISHEAAVFSPVGHGRAGRLAYRGGLILGSDDPRFGGWSDLWLPPDGSWIAMISDAGNALVAPLALDAGGAPESIGPGSLLPLIDLGGRPFALRRLADAEGLAPARDGGFYVSYEGTPRLWHYPGGAVPFGRRPRAVALPGGIDQAPPNGGLEAIAAWPDGTIAMFAEELFDEAGDVQAWVGTPGAWRAVAWSYDGYKPTGAAVAPDDALIVLERRFALFSFAARIVRTDRASLAAGGRVKGEVLGEWGAPDLVDNFEGIACRRGPNGETLVYVVSDDNFRRALQRTLLLCFAIEAG